MWFVLCAFGILSFFWFQRPSSRIGFVGFMIPVSWFITAVGGTQETAMANAFGGFFVVFACIIIGAIAFENEEEPPARAKREWYVPLLTQFM